MASGEEKGEGFLTRWSERKLQAGGGDEPDDPAVEATADPEVAPEAVADEGDAPTLTDADMPPLESLDGGSDYAGFLSPGVSEELRRKALSRLFHGAAFNIADGLDDYAEDFTSFLPLGDIITSDMRHQMEEAAKRLLANEEGAAEPDDESGEEDAAGEIPVLSQPKTVDDGDDRTDGEAA